MWKIEPVKDEDGLYRLGVTKSNYLQKKTDTVFVYLERDITGAWIESDYIPPPKKERTDVDIETEILSILDGKKLNTGEIKAKVMGNDGRITAVLKDMTEKQALVVENKGNATIYSLL